MKKILFMMVVIGGGAMLIKGCHVSVTPENQVRVMGWALPIPESIQSSPTMAIAATLLRAQLPAEANGADSRPVAANATAMRPGVPNITSTNGTYNANAAAPARPVGGIADGASQLNAVAKALR